MRYQQQKHLDTATYKLLRNLEKNLQPIDLQTCKFISSSQHFTLYLWAEIVMPVPMSSSNENKCVFSFQSLLLYFYSSLRFQAKFDDRFSRRGSFPSPSAQFSEFSHGDSSVVVKIRSSFRFVFLLRRPGST